MLIQTLGAALALLIALQDAPADPAAEAMALLHARTLKRCETQPRGAGETVGACADRRANALLGTYGSVAGALGATSGWDESVPPATGPLGFPTLSEGLTLEGGYARSTAAPVQTYQPPQPRCRRETTRSPDGTSASTTMICGDGGDSERAVRESLDRLMQRPQNER